ncbi:MAG: DUF4190 domain-containing protein [Brevinematales bacterium]|nr:DUF4190 domain-containing protein [Brevinematales bacterium]
MPERFLPHKKYQSQILTGFILSVSVFSFTVVGTFILMGLPIMLYTFWSVNLMVLISQVIALVLCVMGILRLDPENERGKAMAIAGILMSLFMVVMMIVMFSMIVAGPSL